jgi:hypothetical protein
MQRKANLEDRFPYLCISVSKMIRQAHSRISALGFIRQTHSR